MEKVKPILVTGAAGFIGAALCARLCEQGATVFGLDNLNNYYDPALKQARLAQLKKYPQFIFVKQDISDKPALLSLFADNNFAFVIHLAAQAGIRYSISNPDAYMQSNVIGFYNILEACRQYPVTHLVYASSSSVYGNNNKLPFAVEDPADNPVSLYAATKKSNELMAHAYSKLFGIAATGLRFFTVYGPLGRPDMAYFSFTQKMVAGQPLQLFNNGQLKRDFTYIDDILSGLLLVLPNPPPPNKDGARYKLYNIGNNNPVQLLEFVSVLEKCLLREGLISQPAVKEFLPMQPGDVYQTYADLSGLEKDFHFHPDTSLEVGLSRFASWYKSFYGK